MAPPLFAFRRLYLLFDQVQGDSDEDEQVRQTARREVRQPKQLKHETIASLAAVFRRKGVESPPLTKSKGPR